MLRRLVYIVSLFITALILLMHTEGCIKEYSYERTPVDTIAIQDSTDTATITSIYSQCPECQKNPDFVLGTWSFAIDTFSFCGNITKAIMLQERTAFTFFGPSECSEDTGLIFTCSLNNPFDTVATNVIVDNVTMRYYNRVGTQDMFDADGTLGFFLIIQSYSQATGIMKGIFSGDVNTDRHTLTHISNGKFEIQFH